MNANLLPPAPTINQWLNEATSQISAAGIPSARLDALILLQDLFEKDKSWVIAHDDTILTSAQVKTLGTKVTQRVRHIPLAYIRGFVEFYGREFIVNPDVLIPRPETEDMIELGLSLDLPKNLQVTDVGTGSGCIAITLKLERPEWNVTATDISPSALAVAKNNSTALHADILYKLQNLLSPPSTQLLTRDPHLITANLPYVTRGFAVSPDTNAEPDIALYANNEGYELIEQLLIQAATILPTNSYLILESDPWQQEHIIQFANTHGFKLKNKRTFHIVLQKG